MLSVTLQKDPTRFRHLWHVYTCISKYQNILVFKILGYHNYVKLHFACFIFSIVSRWFFSSALSINNTRLPNHKLSNYWWIQLFGECKNHRTTHDCQKWYIFVPKITSLRKAKLIWVRLYTHSYSAYDINGKLAINDAQKKDVFGWMGFVLCVWFCTLA